MDSNIFSPNAAESDARNSRQPAFSGPMIVLHRPQIPQNTGNISRLCVALNSPLAITGRAGFDFSDAAVKRAGLDHWQHLQFSHYRRFKDFFKQYPGRRLIAVTKASATSALEFNFSPKDILIFGNETMGLPPALLNQLQYRVSLPMAGPVRSLNLSNSVAVVAYAYVAKVYGKAATHAAQQYPRTYYRRGVTP